MHIPVVTQPHLTIPTKPGGVFTTVTHFAVSTPSSLEIFAVQFIWNPDWKVAQRKCGNLGWPATSSTSTAVITHELSCQL